MCANTSSRQRGFTLISLLVLGVILLLGLSLLAPFLTRIRDLALREQCRSNMAQLGRAAHMFANDYLRFPYGATVLSKKDTRHAGLREDKALKHGWTYDLLPYIEQDAVFRQGNMQHRLFDGSLPNVKAGVSPDGEYRPIYSLRVKSYLCPADEGVDKQYRNPDTPNAPLWARGNYACNAGPATFTESVGGRAKQMYPAGVDIEKERPVLATPVMAMQYALGPGELTNLDGTSVTVLFNEVRTGLSPDDLRGTWALAVPG